MDVTTLSFGPAGTSPAHDLTDSFTYNDHMQDVNLDGFTDLVSHYPTTLTGIECGDGSATLTGSTLDGQPFEGSDSIRTVGCRMGITRAARDRGMAQEEPTQTPGLVKPRKE